MFCSFLLVLVQVWCWCCQEPSFNSIGHFWVTDHYRLPFGAAMYVLYVHPVKNPSRAQVLLDSVERLQSHTSVKGEEKIGWRAEREFGLGLMPLQLSCESNCFWQHSLYDHRAKTYMIPEWEIVQADIEKEDNIQVKSLVKADWLMTWLPCQ